MLLARRTCLEDMTVRCCLLQRSPLGLTPCASPRTRGRAIVSQQRVTPLSTTFVFYYLLSTKLVLQLVLCVCVSESEDRGVRISAAMAGTTRCSTLLQDTLVLLFYSCSSRICVCLPTFAATSFLVLALRHPAGCSLPPPSPSTCCFVQPHINAFSVLSCIFFSTAHWLCEEVALTPRPAAIGSREVIVESLSQCTGHVAMQIAASMLLCHSLFPCCCHCICPPITTHESLPSDGCQLPLSSSPL